MKIAMFSTRPYDRQFFEKANKNFKHTIDYLECRLSAETANIARGYNTVCVFVHDDLGKQVLQTLCESGIKTIALRCAGFNNVDIEAATQLGMNVVRVPRYSPYAVAEHAVALMLSLNRKTHRAYNRVKEGNFSLNGLLGFDIHGKTAGIIGTGYIGSITAGILKGFGAKVIAHDLTINQQCVASGVEYMELDELLGKSDIISLHCPLTPQTHHMINQTAINKMKNGVMIINTSRGEVIDTKSVIQGLKSGKIGYLGMDVYEQEGDLFFRDLSDKIIQDDVFERLLTFPNVLVTGHQGFFTKEALENIAGTTLQNVSQCIEGDVCPNLVTPGHFN